MEKLDYKPFMSSYYNIITQYKRKMIEVKDHRIYEYLWALEKKVILWDDLPPWMEDIYDLPHLNDYGVDLISLNYDWTGQAKLYNNLSYISWTDICKFSTYTKDILGVKKMGLLTTEDARIDSMVKRLLKNGEIILERKSFQELLDAVPEKYESIEEQQESEKIEQRDYLSHCSKLFRESEKNILQFQLPCGMGKSYIILDIILKKMEEEEDSKHIVFVPWIDLMKQLFKTAEKFGIRVGMIGDGKQQYDEDTNLIICVYDSVHLVPNWDFIYKFYDGAHHLENEEGIVRKKLDIIECEKVLYLSATFKDAEEVDYSMNLRDGIEKGYLSDYVFHIEYFTTSNKFMALLKLIKENQEWAPIFIYFNTTEKAIQFCKLLKNEGIVADYLTGKSSRKKRENIIKKVKSYFLPVLCLCGVFNEGISVNELKTVIFGDLRYSTINKVQVSMRGSRKCKDKAYFRIVLPLIKKDFQEKDLQDFMKTFTIIDPKIKDSLLSHSVSRVKIRKNNKPFIEEEGELTKEEIYDSLGNMVKGLSQEEKCNELLKYVKETGIIPCKKDLVLFSNHQNIAKFWESVKFNNKCQIFPYNLLLQNVILLKDYDNYINYSENKISLEEKCHQLIKIVEKNGSINCIDKSFFFTNQENILNFWKNIKINKKCSKYPYKILLNNKVLKENYDKYIEKKNLDIEKEILSIEQKCTQLIDFVEKNGEIPSKSAIFTNQQNINKFWITVKSNNKSLKHPYSELLKNDILKKDYEKYLRKNKNDISTEEKIKQLIEWVEKNEKIPNSDDKSAIFSNEKNMESFWLYVKLRKKCGSAPYSFLLKNILLKQNYDKYINFYEKKLSVDEKCNQLIEFVKKNNNVPSSSDNSIVFSNNQQIGQFWQNIKSKKKCSNDNYSKLLKNDILKKDYNNYLMKKVI